MERINYRKLSERVVESISSKKGSDIIVFDVKSLTSFTDYIIIATVNSSAQIKAVLKDLRNMIKIKADHIEGDVSSGWILADYAGTIVNLMTSEMRSFYRLEKLWGEAKKVVFKCMK